MTMSLRKWLLGSTIVATATLVSAPVIAQVEPQPAPATPTTSGTDTGTPDSTSPAPGTKAPAAASDNQAIVVTGSVFKRSNLDTPSPVTVLNSTQLAQRGITTITDAIQSISSNNAGALPTAFSANGAFASGASGASLRGLSTDSTVVLFDGLRAAYYPLADDAARNFVDLNTIPESIVDRVEVLKDGASATYGADAIAGVINIILKKEIKGFQATGEAGISERGDTPEQRLNATWGVGSLAENGYNFYLNAEYQRDGSLQNKDRGFPYNTSNWSRITGPDGLTGPNNDTGVTAIGATVVPEVRPATEGTPGDITSGVAVPGGHYQFLNGNGCGSLQENQAANGLGPICEEDLVHDYGVIQPRQTRFGTTGHLTVNVGDNAQFYATGTFYQDKVSFTGTPSTIRFVQSQTQFSTANLVLPAILSNGQVNPNDPFAVAGCVEGVSCVDAQIYDRFADIPITTTDLSRTFRGAMGIKGTFGDNWGYSVDATGMHTTLDVKQQGYIYIPGLLAAISDGTYNFVNPSANSQSVIDSIAPQVDQRATSDLAQVQGTLTKELLQLPGGALKLAISGQVRYEKVNDPSANPNGDFYNLNGFSASGHRYNESASFELDAPVLKQLDIDASGRYDHYSEGFSHFSPKIGATFSPIRQVKLRGTFSKGFRVPSFPETTGFSTGFVNAPALPQSFINQHLNADGTPDAYVQTYSLGLNTTGTPNLKPEKSRNFTGGIILEPGSGLRFSVDYYNIKKTGVITTADYSQAISQYYASLTGAGAAPSNIILDIPDPDHPTSPNRIAYVNNGYINANSLITSGLDMEASAQIPLGDSLKFTTSGEATYIFKYNEKLPDGSVYHFAGTLGPYQITSASGTPRWRANWQNTLDFGKYSLTATAYYTSGYKGTADDATGAGTSGDCANALADYSDQATPLRCHVKRFIDVDLTGSIKVTDNFTFYANVLNVFNAKAPFDPNTYGGNGYNPAWAEQGVIGRYMRIGAHFSF